VSAPVAAPPGGFTPLDRLTLAYVTVPTLALALSFRDGAIPGWPFVLLAQVLTVACVLIAPRARGAGPVGRVVGDLYPLLLLPALYGEIGIFTLHRGVVHDSLIQALELRLFGTQVSVDWIRAMPHAALSWLLHASYLAYYPILAAPPLVLWATGRRDPARATVLAVMATFYLHYAVFIFFPVAGPRYFFPLADNAATAVWPARFAQQMLNGADSWGAAFPSSHVAAAVVATGMAWTASRALGLALLPATVGLTLGVVYGQFHYGVDAVTGLAAGLAILGGFAWWGRRGSGSREPAAKLARDIARPGPATAAEPGVAAGRSGTPGARPPSGVSACADARPP